MEIVAKLVQVLEVQTGESKAGTPWKKQEFILETEGQYPKKMCMSMMGADKIAAIEGILKEGNMLKVSFDAESREYNGKWYTNLSAWRVDAHG
jgi:Domain of unknown function (DUF3127)